MYRTKFKNIAQSKIWAPQKTLCHTWCPKMATGLLCPDRPRVHLSGPTSMPSCISPEIKLPLDQRIFEVVVAKKCTMPSPGSLLLF